MYLHNDAWVKRLTPHVALGLRIKELRGLKGMTQEDLAEAVGVFRTYMSRIETGAGNPTFSVLLALAKALGVAIGELLDQPTTVQPARVRSAPGTSRGRVAK